jgi:hypothetical protein
VNGARAAVPATVESGALHDAAAADAGEPDPVPPATPAAEAEKEPETILREGQWAVRAFHPGRPIKRPRLADSPGYTPPIDPEMDAVIRGMRLVDETDIPFTGGEASAEALAWVVLDEVDAGNVKGLHELRITYDEFSQILWPEFPESRPSTKIEAGHAWLFLKRDSAKGVPDAIDKWQGQGLMFEGLSFDVGYTRYTNFTLYRGVRIHAKTLRGEKFALDFAETFAQRDGVWKVYNYKD